MDAGIAHIPIWMLGIAASVFGLLVGFLSSWGSYKAIMRILEEKVKEQDAKIASLADLTIRRTSEVHDRIDRVVKDWHQSDIKSMRDDDHLKEKMYAEFRQCSSCDRIRQDCEKARTAMFDLFCKKVAELAARFDRLERKLDQMDEDRSRAKEGWRAEIEKLNMGMKELRSCIIGKLVNNGLQQQG